MNLCKGSIRPSEDGRHEYRVLEGARLPTAECIKCGQQKWIKNPDYFERIKARSKRNGVKES